jgi:predicted TIM-barrel fold metal-dependent hydrolase
MDEHGIEQAWLLTWEIAPFEDAARYHGVLNPLNVRPDGTHAGITLADLLRARDSYSDRFIVGYCPHPALADAPGLLRAAVNMHNVRVCGEWKFRLPFDDPRCLELFYAAGELKLPVVLHLDVPYLKNEEGQRTYRQSWYGGTVDNLERALQACPQTNFIGHAPGFWREISADADESPEAYPSGPLQTPGKLCRLFDEYSNLYADLSAGSALRALQREPEYSRQFLTEYSDRLLFARDYYEQDLHKFLQTLDLGEDVTEKIYHRNAEKLLT